MLISYLFACSKISSITNFLLLYLIEWSKQASYVMILRAYISPVHDYN